MPGGRQASDHVEETPHGTFRAYASRLQGEMEPACGLPDGRP